MPDAQPRHELSSGWGRALVFVYGVFAVAATGRSAVQLGLDADRAPLAYSLSLVAAVIYLVLVLIASWLLGRFAARFDVKSGPVMSSSSSHVTADGHTAAQLEE